MCGITGFYQTEAGRDRPALQHIGEQMIATLHHRGPDSGDVWQDPDHTLVLAHRRLAILDLSQEGHQPMTSASGRYVMTYNGEIYNYLDLQRELKDANISFRGHSDTEVILAAIDHWGLNLTLQKLSGMFAFVLWDRQEKKLHLLRDRMGKKPLYVGWAGKNLVFASELKAICAHPDFKPELNREAAASYMRFGSVPAPLCIYQKIWAMPAGFRLMIDLQAVEVGSDLSQSMEPYWHHLRVLEEQQQKIDKKFDVAYANQFDALITASVKNRMISDVPLGAFLSGGIDSSLVVAVMQRLSGQPIKTYTIGFKEAGFDEAQYASRIAHHLGTDHHEHYMSGAEARDIIPGLPQMYDEPFGDISAIPTALVAEFARKDVTVALSGDGGDEMMGGYNRHVMGPNIWNKIKFMPPAMRKMMAAGIAKISVGHWDKIGGKQPQFGTRMHKIAAMMDAKDPAEIYSRLISHWPDPEALVKNAKEPETFLNKRDWNADHLGFADRMMYWDALTYLPNDILTKVDRATMAVGLESRAPLLDKRIYEFAWTLPENLKIRNGRGKFLMREVLERYVPASLFERPKQGFAMPVGEWLRGPLKDWAENLLDEKSIQGDGLLDTALIRQTWDDHLAGRGNHATKLWTLLMFQSWKERWL